MNKPVRLSRKPATSFERGKGLSKDVDEYRNVDCKKIIVNAENVRDTFNSIEELKEFLETIFWPDDGIRYLDDPVSWVEEKENILDDKRIHVFKNIVSMALSILKKGQIQPVTVKRTESRYQAIAGSTRVLACYLLNITVDIKIVETKSELEEFQIHLDENLQRENLTFVETFNGYKRLFELLVENNVVKEITRSTIMKQLSFSRTYAAKWNKILNTAISDESFCKEVMKGRFSSVNEAFEFVKPKTEDKSSHETENSETNPNTSPSPLNINSEPETSSTSNDAETNGNKNKTEAVISLDPNHFDLEGIEKFLVRIFSGEIHFHRHDETGCDEEIVEYLDSITPLDSIEKAQEALAWILSKSSCRTQVEDAL